MQEDRSLESLKNKIGQDTVSSLNSSPLAFDINRHSIQRSSMHNYPRQSPIKNDKILAILKEKKLVNRNSARGVDNLVTLT